MKKLMMVAMAVIVAMSSVYAADDFAKRAKKEAKLMKSGKDAGNTDKIPWAVAPGVLPLEMQLEEEYRMRKEKNDEGEKKWIFAGQMSIGENYDGAKMQALTLAINELAQQIQTTVANQITTAGGNLQGGGELPKDEAATALKTVMGSTQWITNTISRVNIIVECYQILRNKNYRVRLTIAYNEKKALDGAKKSLRDELLKEGQELSKEMNKLLLGQ